MDRFMIEIDCWMYDGLEEYLLSLPGILEVSISDSRNFIIDVKYNSDIMKMKVLKLEILFFLGILKLPTIISFHKYPKMKTSRYDMVISDLCCEFCFCGMMEDLLDMDGIEKVTSDFDEKNRHKEQMMMKVDYNPKLIKEAELKQLELKFNGQSIKK